MVRDEQTRDLYLTMTSTVVLKRKKEKLYVPVDFKNGLKRDTLLHSKAFFTAIALIDLGSIKQ